MRIREFADIIEYEFAHISKAKVYHTLRALASMNIIRGRDVISNDQKALFLIICFSCPFARREKIAEWIEYQKSKRGLMDAAIELQEFLSGVKKSPSNPKHIVFSENVDICIMGEYAGSDISFIRQSPLPPPRVNPSVIISFAPVLKCFQYQ